MSGGWGEGEGRDGGAMPTEITLSNGGRMTINPEAWRALLQHPAVIEAIAARAQGVCDAANSLAITEGASYEVTQHADGTASVHAGGENPIKGIVDDAAHSTLLKAMGNS